MNEQRTFIEQLKAEHVAILAQLLEVNSIEDLGMLKKSVQKLITITTEHLRKEDEILYPALAMSKLEDIQKIGLLFSGAMKPYTRLFVSVTQEILTSDNLDAEIRRKFSQMSDKIKARIVIEENVLYSAYNKIANT